MLFQEEKVAFLAMKRDFLRKKIDGRKKNVGLLRGKVVF